MTNKPTDAEIDAIVYEQTGFDGDGTQPMTADEMRRVTREVLARWGQPDGEHTNAAHALLDECYEGKKKCYFALGQHQTAIDNLIKERDALINSASGYGAQLVEENGRKVLGYWPHCSECRKPFEFEKDEPFASCGCPGSTEWGDPRPASWVQPPESNAPQQPAPATQQAGEVHTNTEKTVERYLTIFKDGITGQYYAAPFLHEELIKASKYARDMTEYQINKTCVARLKLAFVEGRFEGTI